jgi:PAS domain S-box-containing protein
MHGENAGKTQDIILDSINEGVFTVDREWRITSFNRAAEKITGIRRKEALGKACHEVFRASICEKSCVLRQTLKTGKPIFNRTAHIADASGLRIPIRISTALLKNGQDRIIGGVETFQDLRQVEKLRKELEARYTFEDIIGHSPLMTDLFRLIPPIADSDSTVLIEGSSGTGKELFAQAIHNLSSRRDKPFVAVNCGALPDTLLESELFGYKAGAFTDARRDKPGRFALADGGTLFLDEIGDISPAMQVRLLRVLQERCVEPLGSVEPLHVNVRILAATNKNLAELVQQEIFREDLFYRIRVIYLRIPNLRQRREDIPLLINHFVTRFNHLYNRQVAGVSHEVLARLMDYDYPGNIRELENILEHGFVLCRGDLIEMRCLPPELRPADISSFQTLNDGNTLKSMEKTLIAEALERHKGNRKQTAWDLGIDTSTLYRKIRLLGIQPPPRDGRTGKKWPTS